MRRQRRQTDRELLELILWSQALILDKENITMALVADVDAALAAEDTAIDSVIALLTTIHDELAALVASGSIDPAALDEVVAHLADRTATIQAAIDANPDPTPPVG